MNDQISRQELIEKLKCETYSINESDYEDYWQGVLEGLNRAIKKAESQPPADQWIPCSERLPNRDEYLKDDGRFIVTDGNRRYQCIFDMYDGKFKRLAVNKLLEEDKCVIAWHSLPEPYKGE